MGVPGDYSTWHYSLFEALLLLHINNIIISRKHCHDFSPKFQNDDYDAIF